MVQSSFEDSDLPRRIQWEYERKLEGATVVDEAASEAWISFSWVGIALDCFCDCETDKEAVNCERHNT